MVDERKEAQECPEMGQWSPGREALSGDDLLTRIAEKAGAGDENKRSRAKAVIDSEEIVETFVYKVRRALRAVRKARGLKTEAAAEMVGVSPSTLSRLETGATEKLDLKLVVQVALMLGVVPRMEFATEGSDASVSVSDLETVMATPEGMEGLDQYPIGPLVVRMKQGPVSFEASMLRDGLIDPFGRFQGYWSEQDPTIRDLQARLSELERKAVLKQE
jgi:transcriptional regulator with XRE-family HTH domain